MLGLKVTATGHLTRPVDMPEHVPKRETAALPGAAADLKPHITKATIT